MNAVAKLGMSAVLAVLSAGCGDDAPPSRDAGVDASVRDAGGRDASGPEDASVPADASVPEDAAPMDGCVAATELCNGLDDDCDGTTDEGVTTTYHRDGDGDGWGTTETTDACELPTGYAVRGDDCDDTNGAVNPDAIEVCANGLDDDCDEGVDDLPECSVDCDWSGARWLSHGFDGGAAFTTGFWLSCADGHLTHLEWVQVSTGATFGPSGTADLQVGCNWSSPSTRWASEGIDGSGAFTNGATITCSGSRVTSIGLVGSTMSGPFQSGDLGCNWSGARFASHGWDGGCAFTSGLVFTCDSGRLTDIRAEEGSCGWDRY